MTRTTVLHITAHMGGGVGKALSNVTIYDKNYDHHLVLLEAPIDTQFTKPVSNSQITIAPSVDVVQELVGWADIVQWDWWHHPLMATVMHSCRNIPTRSVVWCHTSGCYYPYLKPEFVAMPDHFIFTSPYSTENPYWSNLTCANTSTIFSSGGFKDIQDVKLIPHEGFNVGYLGTLGFEKLLPEFVEYCKQASDIPGIKFVIIGKQPPNNMVLKQAEKAGIADKFVFTGWVPDLSAELARLDTMGYLLNKYHYGTTENALLEAMAMGIPPIVMNQNTEKYLVTDNITGFLVNNVCEYRAMIKYLYTHPDTKRRIGIRARSHVLSNFGVENTIGQLDAVYNNVMKVGKHKIECNRIFGKSPFEWYRSGFPPMLPEDPMKYRGKSNGSIGQWHKYYPSDERLTEELKVRSHQ